MALTIILFTIVFVLIVLLIVCIYQIKLQKHYYDYTFNKAEKLETDLKEAVTVKEDLHKKLTRVAYINPVSKIYNLDYFINESSKLFISDPERECTLVTFNISNMGSINKLFGSDEGNRAIVYAASTLRFLAQQSRYLYSHLYSNLFGAMITSTDDSVIHTFIEGITERMKNFTNSYAIEPSFGIYTVTDINVPVLDMINCTMLAQNMNKNIKTCNYNYYSEELDAQFKENKKMSQEMEIAMTEHKFLMYLQPMVNLRNFKIVSAEALVRWNHPEKGILSPYAFLPLLEGTAVIEKLDYYMWEECCRTIRRWIDNKIEPTPISFNISPIHFASTKFIGKINELVKRYLIDKNLLILEIPERGIASTNNTIIKIINELHDNGYHICIDNFGSMSSPLNHLRDLPIDSIKIDRSFINKNIATEEGLTMLRYLIAMTIEIGISVYVEGIETEEQANFLAELGSEVAQGYFFSKPVNLRDFDALNKSMVNRVYKGDEYYPTFEDLEKDLDLIDHLLKQN